MHKLKYPDAIMITREQLRPPVGCAQTQVSRSNNVNKRNFRPQDAELWRQIKLKELLLPAHCQPPSALSAILERTRISACRLVSPIPPDQVNNICKLRKNGTDQNIHLQTGLTYSIPHEVNKLANKVKMEQTRIFTFRLVSPFPHVEVNIRGVRRILRGGG